MSQPHQKPSGDSTEKDMRRNGGRIESVNGSGDPDYQPAFNRVELTEIRAPFWGIANKCPG